MTLCSEWALYTTWTSQLLLSSASSYSDMKQHCRPVWHCYVFLGAVETHQPQAHTHTLMLRTETILHGMCAHVRNCFSWLHCEAECGIALPWRTLNYVGLLGVWPSGRENIQHKTGPGHDGPQRQSKPPVCDSVSACKTAVAGRFSHAFPVGSRLVRAVTTGRQTSRS